MRKNMNFMTVFAVAILVLAVPAFAQHGGLGAGAGLGGGARVGSGAQAGGVGVGARTTTDVQAKTSTEVKSGNSGHANEHAEVHGGAEIATHIDRNPEMASRVQAMLPSGMSMSNAAAGFRNEGQFLAALHVSHNLGIPFADLKAKMTGSEHMSLGEAIHASKPEMKKEEAKEEEKKAEKEAKMTASAKATAKSEISDKQ